MSQLKLITTTPPDSDPVIQINVDHPQTVAVPPKGQISSPIYSGTVTLVNTSSLPLSSAQIQLTLRDDIMGYAASLLNSAQKPVSLLTFPLGPIAPGKSASASYLFRIDSVVPNPPPVQSSAWVQLNVLPGYEINYAQTDGFQSTATAVATSDQSPPGTASHWSTDTFTSDPVIKVNHSFWKSITEPLKGGGYARGSVNVQNVAQVPLTSVTLQLQIDDDGARWMATLVNSDGGAPAQQETLDMGGPIAAGSPGPTQQYWWDLQHIGGTTLQSESLNVYFNLMPSYTVQYQLDNETFKIRMGVTAA